LKGENPALQHAEKLYGKDFAEQLSLLLNEVHNVEVGTRVGGVGASEFGFGEKATKQAGQKAINIVYGRLSRRGAQLSSIMSAIIDQLDTAEMRNRVLQRAFAEPDEFKRLLGKTKIKETSKAKQLVRNWVYGTTRADEDQSQRTNAQTDEILK
jgi:hypothetical protein